MNKLAPWLVTFALFAVAAVPAHAQTQFGGQGEQLALIFCGGN